MCVVVGVLAFAIGFFLGVVSTGLVAASKRGDDLAEIQFELMQKDKLKESNIAE